MAERRQSARFDNPVLRLGLGLCPAMAVATSAINGLGLGVATACVLVCTAAVAALLGGVVDEKGRLPVFLLASAAFATVAQQVMKGWFPALNEALGLFVPLIAVNCLILRGADVSARGGFGGTVGMAFAYVCALTLIGLVREVIGSGAAFGASVLPAGCEPMLMAALPAGGLLALGLLLGILNAVRKRGKGASA